MWRYITKKEKTKLYEIKIWVQLAGIIYMLLQAKATVKGFGVRNIFIIKTV